MELFNAKQAALYIATPTYAARVMITYDLHPQARLDLDEIWEFIRRDNLDAADKVIADILASLDALTTFPNRGHKRPDLTSVTIYFGA